MMQNAVITKNSTINFKRLKTGLVIGWTLLLLCVLLWHWQQVKNSMREDIIISLQTIMDKNFAFLD